MEKTSFKENMRIALTAGTVIGFLVGLFGGSIVSGLIIGLMVGSISCIMFSIDVLDSPIKGLLAGSFFGGGIGSFIGFFFAAISENSAVISIGLLVGVSVGGYTTFIRNYKNKELRIQHEKQITEYVNKIEIYVDSHEPLKFGVENPIKIIINNNTETTISNAHLITKFPKTVICNETIVLIDEVSAEASESKTLFVTPTVANEIDLGDLKITLEIDGKTYGKQLVKIGTFDVIPPKIDIQIDVPNPLKVEIENPVKITVKNQSDVSLSNVQIKANFSRLITCDETTVHTDDISANSSDYTAIFMTPRIADMINLGELDISYDINGFTYKKEPIAIGTYEAIEVNSYKPEKYIDNVNSDLSISRETEFYQGYIRFKMSVTNTSSFVVNDVALDFDYDNNLLRIDRREPDYRIKNDRTIFGNISANSSKTIAVYFDPMMCSKGADINCQVNYKDAKGQPQTTHMKPKQISVVCPIMETESDINIGRLKEFIEKLPYRDSKVYQIQNGFDIYVLKNISREIVQKHDVKHIRTLFTKDRNTCEIWYYGKTKVHGHDIVIKITILSETKSIELFAATETVESLAGLLAEVGRELKGAIESKVTGNVQQVINVSIKDSIVQRSNLLSSCDINGNCSGDVVIEDSLVQRSNIGFDVKTDNSTNVPTQTLFNDVKINVNLDVISLIKKQFTKVGNPAQVPLLNGNESFEAELSNDGIIVDNLGNSPLLPWSVFVESVSLLKTNGGRAKRGDAIGSKEDPRILGDEKLPLDSIEGHIAHVVYGKQVGNSSIFRRITPVACILIWAKICKHKTGELLLSDNYIMMYNKNIREKQKRERMNLNKHEIHEYLISIANEQRKVTYGHVMKECDENVNGAEIANKLIKLVLDPISDENIQNNEPLLAALVVNGKTNIPGPGFFTKWMATYRDYTGPSDGPEAEKVHNEELERVFSHWHSDNKNSCPACGGVVPDAAKFCMECGEKLG